mgnify:CR=1 FL=1
MKRKILQFILKRLKNSNYTSFKECYECAVKRGSPQLCEQCYWVRENYKPNRIIFMNQQEERYASLDYLVKDFIQSIQGSTTDWQERQLKKFLQSEINLALANRDKEIVEIVKANTPTHITREYRDTDKMRDTIINLITKVN